jgi:hypothetical protein
MHAFDFFEKILRGRTKQGHGLACPTAGTAVLTNAAALCALQLLVDLQLALTVFFERTAPYSMNFIDIA